MTAQIAVAQRRHPVTEISGLIADRCVVIVFNRRLKLHLRGVREIPVARINKVGDAPHEALLDPKQVRAIVHIRMVHALILRLLVRLQLGLAEGVTQRECERDDNTKGDYDSQQYFQIPPAHRAPICIS